MTRDSWKYFGHHYRVVSITLPIAFISNTIHTISLFQSESCTFNLLFLFVFSMWISVTFSFYFFTINFGGGENGRHPQQGADLSRCTRFDFTRLHCSNVVNVKLLVELRDERYHFIQTDFPFVPKIEGGKGGYNLKSTTRKHDQLQMGFLLLTHRNPIPYSNARWVSAYSTARMRPPFWALAYSRGWKPQFTAPQWCYFLPPDFDNRETILEKCSDRNYSFSSSMQHHKM